VLAEALLDLGRLCEQSDDPTHMFSIYIGLRAINRLVPTIFEIDMCRFST
jgi:hypothetical protein